MAAFRTSISVFFVFDSLKRFASASKLIFERSMPRPGSAVMATPLPGGAVKLMIPDGFVVSV